MMLWPLDLCDGMHIQEPDFSWGSDFLGLYNQGKLGSP